ncbi:putative WD-repeat protein [Zostera marina]|uniref:Putative WD-repeat protein n=1 Tax=Zostera marina TaxID=29655 RepID=A0A0K9PA07_ZOSMR|nr:putative WD-repeat protein [Zostera marina]
MGEVVTSTADEHRQQDGEIAIPYSGEIHYDYDHYSSHRKLIRFEIPPRRSYHFARQFRTNTTTGILSANNFLKGIKWSPDGSCLLTCSDDNSLHIFARPDDAYCCYETAPEVHFDDKDSYDSYLVVNEGESVYDYCWYPYMSTTDPNTCVFASTARDHPIHLWDAMSGQLRCTYRAYDAMDEITAALSIAFNSSGTKIFAGYNKSIKVFDIHRPGRDFQQYSTVKGEDGFSGIVSSISFSPTQSKLIAMGSYSQTTAIYSEDNMELLFVLHGQIGGVTQVQFSKDGNYLYSGGRKDPYIFCWDIRNTSGIVYKLYRSSESTNQRISFDIETSGRHLGTGGEDGLIHIYDLQTGEWTTSFKAASDTVNGFSFHPSLSLAASSSGERRFSMPGNCEDGETILNLKGDQNCASIWTFACLANDDCENAAVESAQ